MKPFKAPSVSVITQSEARKAWEEKEEQERLEKERREHPELYLPVVKPDSVKPTEVLQQSILPIRKKEPPKPQVQTIEIKNEKAEKNEQAEDIFAPVPLDTTPID